MQWSRARVAVIGAILVSSVAVESAHAAACELGRRPFRDVRNPPSYHALGTAEQAQVTLGHAVFNTQWVPAGTAGAARRDGLGPLFNAAACDECHNEGAHGRGPSGDGDAPIALVMQLETPPHRDGMPQRGDPRYGLTLNTSAIPGIDAEGRLTIRYRVLAGHYFDGASWTLRAPRYVVSDLRYGPLSVRTILEPRLAPALFGVGLLAAVPGKPGARFGWQGTSTSIRDQTTKAFSRDMGLTSSVVPHDDCTTMQPACRAGVNGGTPEVSAEFLAAVVAFQRNLAVPDRRAMPADLGPMRGLFADLGCAACHRPRLPANIIDAAGSVRSGIIEPYTDLRLHDLGPGLADRTITGEIMPSRWRTAPLWGLGYRLSTERAPTFLHDGRARSIEEAILWHDGEARLARVKFERLSGSQRLKLLLWLGTL